MTRKEALDVYRRHGLLLAQFTVREDVAARLVELERAEQHAREERDEAERAVKDLMAEASRQAARADGLAEQVRRVWQHLNIAGMPATPDALVAKYREVERERDNLRACNEAMREPMRLLRALASMPAEGESAVVDRVIAMFRAAERREAGLRKALEREAMNVSMERTWCRICRTEHRSLDPKRVHPHKEWCALFHAALAPAPEGERKRCPCGEPRCSGVDDGAHHQCGGPGEACGVGGCSECGTLIDGEVPPYSAGSFERLGHALELSTEPGGEWDDEFCIVCGHAPHDDKCRLCDCDECEVQP